MIETYFYARGISGQSKRWVLWKDAVVRHVGFRHVYSAIPAGV
jgi:hypothetical protein